MKLLVKNLPLFLIPMIFLALSFGLLPQDKAYPDNSKKPESKAKKKEQEEKEKQKLQEELKKRPILQKAYIKKIMRRAEEHFFKKRYNVALKLFQSVIQKDPENPRAYRYAGDVYLIQRKLKEAKEHFEVARELSPEPQKEWLRIAQVYILSEKSAPALAALNKALSLQPEMYLCHFYLGLVYYNLLRDKKNTIRHWEIYRDHVKGEERRKIERALEILRRKDFKFPARNNRDSDHLSPGNY